MADVEKLIGGHNGVAFMVSAGLVYEVVAAACSSPQTTEINAQARADTLMKWVKIGLVQAAVLVAIGAYIEEDHWPAIVGGSLAAGALWFSYAHALKAGLQSNAPGTETYEQPQTPVVAY